jgi:hypothetical protein
MTTPQEAAIASDAAFTGTVIAMSQPPAAPVGALPGTADTVYTFAVDGVAKGELGSQVSVLAGGDGASCGMAFAANVRYVVFAYTQEGTLTTDLCAGSTELPVGEAGPLPMRAPVISDSAAELPIAPIALGLAVLGVVAVSVVAFRRAR